MLFHSYLNICFKKVQLTGIYNFFLVMKTDRYVFSFPIWWFNFFICNSKHSYPSIMGCVEFCEILKIWKWKINKCKNQLQNLECNFIFIGKIIHASHYLQRNSILQILDKINLTFNN